MFQTIWVSDRNSAGEPVRQFDFVQLLLNGLAQFELVDVVQDEHRLDDLAESLHRLIEAMLVRIGIQAAENARCRCLFELDRNDQAQKVVPGFENDLFVYVFLWRNHPVAAFVLAVPELVECLFLQVLEPWCIGNTEQVSEAENRFLEPVFVRGMDRALDDIVVYQPVDDIGTLAFSRTDHQRVPEQPALIDEAVPIFRTFTLIWGNFADFRSVRP